MEGTKAGVNGIVCKVGGDILQSDRGAQMTKQGWLHGKIWKQIISIDWEKGSCTYRCAAQMAYCVVGGVFRGVAQKHVGFLI